MVYQSEYTQHERFPDLLATTHDDGNGVIVIASENRVTLQIHLLTATIVRVRYAEYGIFDSDFSYAIDPAFERKLPEYYIKETEDDVLIHLPEFYIQVARQHLKVAMWNYDDQPILQDEKGYHWEESYELGGNIVQMTKVHQPGEAYYGLGDKPTHMNLRGKRLVNWGTDEYGYPVHKDPIYKSIPFYYGLHSGMGYGLFFDNSYKTHFDFASERQNVTSFWAMGGDMNYYYIHGPSLLDVSERYALLTGKPEMPPMWSLGYQQSKWSYQPQSQVLDIASTMREKKLPCDVIHIDIDYMDGFRCFTWDKEKFPDPKGMTASLHADGMKVVVIIDPGIKIDFDYEVFTAALEKDYFCKRADGGYIKGKVWPGDCYFPDFTRPEVREWWASLYKELIQDIGIDGVWNDMNEPALFEVDSKTFPDDVRHDYDGNPCSHRKAHNVYGMQMARATHEGQKQWAGNKRTLTITRSCYSGVQRYSAGWTGDNIASWDHVWAAAVQCTRLSISGMSFIGADVGGFIQQPTGELYIRFLQIGMFHPFFRTHSSGDHGDQEPWSFGEQYTDYARSNIEMRYKLLPYLYTSFFQCASKGTPFLKPLAWESQTDSQCIHSNEVTIVGDHILTAPVISPDVKGRTVYLPPGGWYNYWNADYHQGADEAWIDVSLAQAMIMIRAGAVIPFFPVQQYVGELDFDYIDLICYYAEEETESMWYEDDGSTLLHAEGERVVHRFITSADEQGYWIQHTQDGDFPQRKSELRISLVGFPEEISICKVDGKEVSARQGVLHVDSQCEEIRLLY